MKKILCLFLALMLTCPLFSSCSDDYENATAISFAQASSVETLKALDGKAVSIIGYMSTLSPVSGSYIYLMNLPYQSCPFCVPNTTQLSNTIAVYAKSGKEFDFTDRAILVKGILEFGTFVDDFGYSYNYRIKNAEYNVLDTSELSGNILLWQQLASTEVISDVYAMYDYLNFLCYWPSYTLGSGSNKDYVWISDAIKLVTTDGAQYNYGYKDGYFDKIIAQIEEVDPNAFSDLVQNVRDAKALAEKALAELIEYDENGNIVYDSEGNIKANSNGYTLVSEYSKDSSGNFIFGDGRYQYKLVKESELSSEMDALYLDFSNWLSSWEL